VDKYYINENTLMIMPYNGIQSKVIESYISYVVNRRPYDIINDSCKSYGSSLQGRCEATDYMIGVKYKCPIVISEVKEIIMFPTTSAKKNSCMWINYNSIEKYSTKNSKESIKILKNGFKITLEISNHIISNQIFKSSRLESVLKSKKR